MKITVIFPTLSEAKYFNNPNAEVEFSGVGLTSSAYNSLRVIRDKKPDVVIMAGIAGVYKHSSLKIGDTLVVSHEREADLGFFFPDGFRHISEMSLDMDFEITTEIECPYITENIPFKTAKSISMNAAMAGFVKTSGYEIENMEGSAFFFVCKKENQRFYELRTISNVVDINSRDEWDYDTSIKNLTKSLDILIDYIIKQ